MKTALMQHISSCTRSVVEATVPCMKEFREDRIGVVVHALAGGIRKAGGFIHCWSHALRLASP